MLMAPQSSYRLRYQITRRNSIFSAWRNKWYRQLTPQLCCFNQYKGSAEGFSRGFSRAKQTAGSIPSAEFAEAVWVKKRVRRCLAIQQNKTKQSKKKKQLLFQHFVRCKQKWNLWISVKPRQHYTEHFIEQGGILLTKCLGSPIVGLEEECWWYTL